MQSGRKPRSSRQCTTAVLAAVMAAALLGSAALAIIDPKFTPVHLVRQSDTILSARLKATADPAVLELQVLEMLKGRAVGPQAVRLASFKKEGRPELRKLLAQNGDRPVMFFYTKVKKVERAFLHVSGTWFVARSAGVGQWDLLSFDMRMDRTYAGGTDIFPLMVKYILEDPDAAVPVAVGTSWMDAVRVAKLREVTGVAAVERGGKVHLFVASSRGDRVFRPKGDGDLEFEDVTAAAKLDSRSRLFAWVDMNRDGAEDLVSFDGRAVQLRVAGPRGEFPAAGPARTIELRGGCGGLLPVSVSGDGAPAVLVSTDGVPLLLEWSPRAGWKKAPLPAPPAGVKGAGRASTCIAADLDGDGFVDILQPRESAGFRWKGRAGGVAAPVKVAVCCRGGGAKSALGDFDGDGRLDIFLSSSSENRLWEQGADGRFQDVVARAGSLSYKCAPGASQCEAADLDHDGRPDLAVAYPEIGFVYHFSRGYRCLAEEGGLRLTDLDEVPIIDSWGVGAFAMADFNADGAEDMAVALAGGEVFCYYNDLFEAPVVKVRLKKGWTGPVTVSSWQGDEHPVCTGTWAVGRHGPPRAFGLRDTGECILRYRLPGAPRRVRKVEVGEKSPTVFLDR